MINKIEDYKELEKEIERFISTAGISKCKKDTAVSLSKGLIMLKQTKVSAENEYYGECLFSDLLTMIYLLRLSSKRLFYIIYRSAIENTIRFILDLKKTDDTSVTKLFRMFKGICGTRNSELYDWMENEYNRGCEFAHSNVRAAMGMGLAEYYSDLTIGNLPSDKDVQELLEVEKKYIDILIILVIEIRSKWIDEAFFREKQKLKFLLQNEQYSLFEGKIE